MGKPLTDEQRAELIAQTKDAAQFFLEDLAHIRQIIAAAEADAGTIRRMSAILRRLLVERSIAAIATPRIGRITLDVPDLKPVYVISRKTPPHFFLCANTTVFGSRFASFVTWPPGVRGGDMPGLDDPFISLNIDSFLKQQVIYAEDTWISRSDVIKYVANVSSGVHAGVPQIHAEAVLHRTRKQVMMTLRDGVPSLGFGPMLGPQPELIFDKKHIDGVLIELLATADRMVNSKDVLTLEAIVEAET